MMASAENKRGQVDVARASLTARQNVWVWSIAAGIAVTLFSVSVPVSATVYDVPVLAALAVGLLVQGSVLLSLINPRWAIASWLGGTAVFFVVGSATPDAPWPLDVCGLLSLCALLVSLGLRRPAIEGIIAWFLAVGLQVLVGVYAGSGVDGTKIATVGGVIGNVVTTTSISAIVLLFAVLLGQRGMLRGELASEQERRSIVEERNRIARELHDVVAHSMSVIQVQASTAPYRMPSLDEASRAEFAEIAASARSALQEMRQLLGVLRSEHAGVEGMPQPGIGQVDDLVASTKRAGIDVSVMISPELPDEGLVSLAAYRIVQESLSNVVRHAPGARTRVRGELVDGVVMISVENDRPSAAPTGVQSRDGHGLIGMRERCVMFGGDLYAGPTEEGGYRVLATLPLTTSTSPDSVSAS
jgi:signal transduction histidine kinase